MTDWISKLKEADKELRSPRAWTCDWSEDAVRDHHDFFLRIGRDEQHCTHPATPFLALSRNLWPEIVAVIEAAWDSRIDVDSEVYKTLAALKKKVEEQ